MGESLYLFIACVYSRVIVSEWRIILYVDHRRRNQSLAKVIWVTIDLRGIGRTIQHDPILNYAIYITLLHNAVIFDAKVLADEIVGDIIMNDHFIKSENIVSLWVWKIVEQSCQAENTNRAENFCALYLHYKAQNFESFSPHFRKRENAVNETLIFLNDKL